MFETRSPVPILPFDEQIVNQTEAENNESVPRRKQKRSEISGKGTAGEHGI